MTNLINYTNTKFNNWYNNVKLDYGVIGSATCKIEDNNFVVEYTEDGSSKTWSMAFYTEYVLDNGMDYFFNVWAEDAR